MGLFRNYIAFILTFTVFVSQAQLPEKVQNKLDSLISITKAEVHDTSKANAILQMTYIYHTIDPDTVIPLCKMSIAIADSGLIGVDGKVKRSFLKTKGTAINNMGYMFKYHGDIKKALDLYSQSLIIFEEIGDKAGIARSLNNLANIYGSLGERAKTIEYLEKVLLLEREIDNKEGEAYALNNIGGNFRRMGENEKAMKYFQEALKIQEEQNISRGIAYTCSNIGLIHMYNKEYEKAIEFEQRSLDIQTELNDKQGVANALQNLAEIYYRLEDNKNALEYANKGYKVSQEIGHPLTISGTSKLLKDIYAKEGDWKKAYEFEQIHIQMRDSLKSAEVKKASMRQQIGYEFEKEKALETAEHEQQLKLAEEKEKRQQLMINYVVGGLVLVIIFTIVILNRLRITRAQKQIIEAQKTIVDEANRNLEEQMQIVEEKNQEITSSITYAKRIQIAILPSQSLIDKFLKEFFVFYKARDIVSGDFYWFYPLNNEEILIAAVDCTGHGVPGAFMSIVGNNGLNKAVIENKLTRPSDILNMLNEHVVNTLRQDGNEVKDGMDIALCKLNINTGLLEYSGAYNPLYLIRGGKLEEIKANRQPIGDVLVPFDNQEFKLSKGDSFYIFTDGYADQFGGPEGKKFSYKRLRDLLSDPKLTMQEMKDALEHSLEEWKENLEQVDDICVVGVKL